jgi:hypothetical protein
MAKSDELSFRVVRSNSDDETLARCRPTDAARAFRKFAARDSVPKFAC